LVTCNEEDTDGRARVTADEEWVLRVVVTPLFLLPRPAFLLAKPG